MAGMSLKQLRRLWAAAEREAVDLPAADSARDCDGRPADPECRYVGGGEM
jgi:hypothetical protein